MTHEHKWKIEKGYKPTKRNKVSNTRLICSCGAKKYKSVCYFIIMDDKKVS